MIQKRQSLNSVAFHCFLYNNIKGSPEFDVGRFYPVCILKSMRYVFFAHPLRVLNEIFDLSKATSARPRKLGDRIILVHPSLSPRARDWWTTHLNLTTRKKSEDPKVVTLAEKITRDTLEIFSNSARKLLRLFAIKCLSSLLGISGKDHTNGT
jgi:hypothetical protein